MSTKRQTISYHSIAEERPRAIRLIMAAGDERGVWWQLARVTLDRDALTLTASAALIERTLDSNVEFVAVRGRYVTPTRDGNSLMLRIPRRRKRTFIPRSCCQRLPDGNWLVPGWLLKRCAISALARAEIVEVVADAKPGDPWFGAEARLRYAMYHSAPGGEGEDEVQRLLDLFDPRREGELVTRLTEAGVDDVPAEILQQRINALLVPPS